MVEVSRQVEGGRERSYRKGICIERANALRFGQLSYINTYYQGMVEKYKSATEEAATADSRKENEGKRRRKSFV